MAWTIWKDFLAENGAWNADIIGRITVQLTADGIAYAATDADGEHVGLYGTRKAAKAAITRLDYHKTQRELAAINAAEQAAQREQ